MCTCVHVCGGIAYTVTRCVFWVSSMVTVCQCIQYQFSPVARHGQGVKLRNTLPWLMSGITTDDSYSSPPDQTPHWVTQPGRKKKMMSKLKEAWGNSVPHLYMGILLILQSQLLKYTASYSI